MVDIKKEHAVETYKSLIQISIEAMKTLLLLNGGAAVALLAYLGNSCKAGNSAPDMRCPMSLFAAGLFFCGITFVCSYLTQLTLHNENLKSTDNSVPSYHKVWLYIGIVMALLSLVCFILGSLSAVAKFQ